MAVKKKKDKKKRSASSSASASPVSINYAADSYGDGVISEVFEQQYTPQAGAPPFGDGVVSEVFAQQYEQVAVDAKQYEQEVFAPEQTAAQQYAQEVAMVSPAPINLEPESVVTPIPEPEVMLEPEIELPIHEFAPEPMPQQPVEYASIEGDPLGNGMFGSMAAAEAAVSAPMPMPTPMSSPASAPAPMSGAPMPTAAPMPAAAPAPMPAPMQAPMSAAPAPMPTEIPVYDPAASSPMEQGAGLGFGGDPVAAPLGGNAPLGANAPLTANAPLGGNARPMKPATLEGSAARAARTGNEAKTGPFGLTLPDFGALNPSFGGKGGKRKVKKGALPTKRRMNLYYTPPRKTNPTALALGFAVVFIAFLVLIKFTGIDLWVQANDAKSKANAAQLQLNALTSGLNNYSETKLKYMRYAATDEELANISRTELLDLIQQKLGGAAYISSLSISKNTASIQVSGLTLAQLSDIVLDMEKSPLISNISVNTAATSSGKQNSGEAISASMVINLADAKTISKTVPNAQNANQNANQNSSSAATASSAATSAGTTPQPTTQGGGN